MDDEFAFIYYIFVGKTRLLMFYGWCKFDTRSDDRTKCNLKFNYNEKSISDGKQVISNTYIAV